MSGERKGAIWQGLTTFLSLRCQVWQGSHDLIEVGREGHPRSFSMIILSHPSALESDLVLNARTSEMPQAWRTSGALQPREDLPLKIDWKIN